jgi:hypothetical protein
MFLVDCGIAELERQDSQAVSPAFVDDRQTVSQ